MAICIISAGLADLHINISELNLLQVLSYPILPRPQKENPVDTITNPCRRNVQKPLRGDSGAYKEMLVRLLTRQIYAESATAEVFGRAISAAPNWQEKELAAEFASEEARHCRGLYDILS